MRDITPDVRRLIELNEGESKYYRFPDWNGGLHVGYGDALQAVMALLQVGEGRTLTDDEILLIRTSADNGLSWTGAVAE